MVVPRWSVTGEFDDSGQGMGWKFGEAAKDKAVAGWRRYTSNGNDFGGQDVRIVDPETRAALEMFARWDPDVFVDLHTTDGSYHGYALTYSPTLNPAALTLDGKGRIIEPRKDRDAVRALASKHRVCTARKIRE